MGKTTSSDDINSIIYTLLFIVLCTYLLFITTNNDQVNENFVSDKSKQEMEQELEQKKTIPAQPPQPHTEHTKIDPEKESHHYLLIGSITGLILLIIIIIVIILLTRKSSTRKSSTTSSTTASTASTASTAATTDNTSGDNIAADTTTTS